MSERSLERRWNTQHSSHKMWRKKKFKKNEVLKREQATNGAEWVL